MFHFFFFRYLFSYFSVIVIVNLDSWILCNCVALFFWGEDIETMYKFALTIIIFYVPFTYLFPLLLPMSFKHLNFPLMHM